MNQSFNLLIWKGRTRNNINNTKKNLEPNEWMDTTNDGTCLWMFRNFYRFFCNWNIKHCRYVVFASLLTIFGARSAFQNADSLYDGGGSFKSKRNLSHIFSFFQIFGRRTMMILIDLRLLFEGASYRMVEYWNRFRIWNGLRWPSLQASLRQGNKKRDNSRLNKKKLE